MKKSTRRWKDDRITPSSGNVFVDLGFDEAEAHVMALRAELMVRLSQELKAKGWTQAQAAKRLGVTQPGSRSSTRVRGRTSVWTCC